MRTIAMDEIRRRITEREPVYYSPYGAGYCANCGRLLESFFLDGEIRTYCVCSRYALGFSTEPVIISTG